MNLLAKQIIDDDGEALALDDHRWHYVADISGDRAIICTGEFIDDAASSGNGSLYETKTTKRGGITCENCIAIIREYKAIRL